MNRVRKLTAPLSAVFLIFVAGFAFANLQVKTEYPPPILDPEFNLWGSNPTLGGKTPMIWELEYEKSVGDQILLQETVAADKQALEIQIFQDGSDDNLTYVRLGQTIDGIRVRALFDEDVGIWVLLQASCACKGPISEGGSIFEIETNDGTHTLDFFFVETAAEASISPSHRTIFLQTPMGEWAYHSIDLVGQYRNAQWNPPDRISLSIIFSVSGSAAGWHTAYVHGFSVTKKTTLTSTQDRASTLPFLSTTSSPRTRMIDQRATPSQEACLPVTRSPCTSNARLSQRFNL
ncbi:MAG: hypothetical protein ABSG74_04650 [Candidatus Bathyarchaeia archaeon]